MRLKEKRGLLYGAVIFIILNVAFFALMLISIFLFSTGINVYEQTYSKQIALLIDSMKPGTNLTIDIYELYEVAKKEKYNGEIVNINKETREVTISLAKGEGYSFRHFNGAAIEWRADKQNKTLYVYAR